jgi:DnaJ family protein C protein 16
VQRFGITKFPTLIVISDSENYKGIHYDGALSRDNMEKFLNQYAYSAIKIEKDFSIKPLTGDLYNRQKICNDSDKNICVIYTTPRDTLTGKENEALETLLKKYSNDPIKVYFINVKEYKYFWVSFSEKEDEVQFIILRGNRKKYMPVYKKTEEISLTEVTNTIDNILSGSGNFKKLVKKLNLNTKAEGKEDL